MPDLDDLDLDRPNPPDPDASASGRGPRLALGLLVVALGVGVAYWFFPRTRSQPAATQSAEDSVRETTAAVEEPARPVERVALPALAESDDLVRGLVSALSSHPTAAAWLTTKGLIRNFVVVVDNIADGATPAKHLKTVAPAESFRVSKRGQRLSVDPRAYSRYDRFAEAVAAVDAQGAAELYWKLRPLMGEAYQELGRPAARFDAAMARAIDSMLNTPAVRADVALTPKIVSYAYEDPALERLTPAQKQLLRMGPRNAQRIQDKLRELQTALKLPSDRATRR